MASRRPTPRPLKPLSAGGAPRRRTSRPRARKTRERAERCHAVRAQGTPAPPRAPHVARASSNGARRGLGGNSFAQRSPSRPSLSAVPLAGAPQRCAAAVVRHRFARHAWARRGALGEGITPQPPACAVRARPRHVLRCTLVQVCTLNKRHGNRTQGAPVHPRPNFARSVGPLTGGATRARGRSGRAAGRSRPGRRRPSPRSSEGRQGAALALLRGAAPGRPLGPIGGPGAA
jgi:hypothetical protein